MANKEVAPGSVIALDSTLPPTPGKRLLEAGGAAVYALSQDPALTRALAEAGGDQCPIHIATSFTELRVLVEMRQCKIALLDADLLGRGLRKQITELKAIEPTLVAVVAAPRDAAEDLIGLLSERIIHRLLIKPAAVGISRLLLESAVSRHLQLRDELEKSAFEPMSAPKRELKPRPKPGWPAWLLAVALVSMLAGAVAVGSLARFDFWTARRADKGEPAAATVAPPEPAAATVAPPKDGGALKSEALVGRAVPSVVSSASAPVPPAPEELTSARVEDPFDAVFSEAEQALLAGDYDAAERALARVKRVQPESSRLHFLETQLARGRELQPETQTPDPELEKQLASALAEAALRRAHADMLARGVTRIEEGQLIAPERDSALHHLERLRAENPSFPGLDSALDDLSGRLAGEARAAIEAHEWESADARLAALSRVAPDSTVTGMRAELAAARLQEDYLTAPAAPGELKILSVSAIEYPESARRRGIEGWVDMEFVVGADGIPREARVVGAEPSGYFEEAALAAISLYRYEPFERDGRVYERLTNVRMRFDLE